MADEQDTAVPADAEAVADLIVSEQAPNLVERDPLDPS